MARLALHTLVRSVALVALALCFQQGWIVASDDPLGQGMSAFFALAGLAGVWGMVDGWLFGVGPLALMWVVAGVAVTVALSVTGQLPGGVDVAQVVGDALEGAPVLVTLVALPAILLGALVAAITPRRSALPR